HPLRPGSHRLPPPRYQSCQPVDRLARSAAINHHRRRAADPGTGLMLEGEWCAANVVVQFLTLGGRHMPARPCPHCGWTIKYATKRCQGCVKPLPKEFQELPEPPPYPAAPASAPVQHASPASVNAKTARHPLTGALQFFKRLFGFKSAGGHYEAALRYEEK